MKRPFAPVPASLLPAFFHGPKPMPPLPLSSPVYPFRLFSFEVDGNPHSKGFDHPAGVSPGALDAELNREFHAWLESVRPGYFNAGRILRIAFTDRIRHAENSVDGAECVAPWGTSPVLPPVSEVVPAQDAGRFAPPVPEEQSA